MLVTRRRQRARDIDTIIGTSITIIVISGTISSRYIGTFWRYIDNQADAYLSVVAIGLQRVEIPWDRGGCHRDRRTRRECRCCKTKCMK